MTIVYLDHRSTDIVALPRDVALRAAETVQAVAYETVPALEQLHSLAWQAGSHELVTGLDALIGRLTLAGRDMHAFAGIATAADAFDPDGITAPGHGAAA